MSHSVPAEPMRVDPPGSLIESLGAGVAVLTQAGHLRFVNGRFREMANLEAEDPLARDLPSLVHPDDKAAVEAALSRAAGGEDAEPIEVRLLRSEADHTWVKITLTPLAQVEGAEGDVVALVTEVTGGRATAVAFAESEVRLRALLESIPAMVIVADGVGRAIFTNRAWEDFSGLTADDGPNWIGRGYIHPEDLPGAIAAWQGALASGEAYDIDYRVVRPTGEYCWVAFKISPVLDPAGSVVAWTSAAIDIDERVRDRESLVQSEARLRALIDATPAMVVITDRLGVTQLVSQQWTAFTGLDMEQTQDWEQLKMIHPEDAEATSEVRRVGLESRKGYSVDYRLRRADGVYRWLNATVRPAISPDGRVLGWMFVAVDVHDRVLSSQRLEQLNADLRLLAESIPAIVVTSPGEAGIAPFANGRWTEYTGVPLEEVTPETVAQLIHRRDVERVLEAWEKARDGRSAYEIEFRLRRADGAYRWFSWRAQPMSDADGAPIGWITVAVEIDDQVRTREQLEATNEHLRVLSDAGQAIAEASDYDSGISAAVATVVPSFADWCTVDLREGETIVRKVALHSGAIDAEHGRVLAATPPPIDRPDDLITGVILTGQSVFIPRMPRELSVFRRTDEQLEAVRGIAPNSSMAVPLRSHGGRTYGALSVARVQGRPAFTGQDFTMVEELGRRFGALLDRARLFSEVLRVVGHLRLLADAGLALSNSGELEEALERSTTLLVPDYADLCTVDLVEGDAIKRVRVAHSLRVDADLAEELRSTVVPRSASDNVAVRIVDGGEPVLISPVPDDMEHIGSRSQAERVRARRFNSGSTIGVPLRAGDRTFGVLGLMRVRGRELFDESDLRLAIELGRQLGGWIERARLFSELRQALSAKDEFFGFVSHELKTPLTTVAGVSDVLARRYAELDESDRREALALIHRDSRRLEEIIANMLTLARSERSSGDEPALVQHIMASTVATHLQRNPDRPVDVRAPGGLPPVLAPSGWLDRVLENLISNAEKYSAPGSTIELDARADGGHIEVRVLDRGRGISPEQMAEVFEPFFRANPNESGVSGVGLGLTVCRRLIERLGGEVWLAPREGGGTEAGFRLPIMAVPED